MSKNNYEFKKNVGNLNSLYESENNEVNNEYIVFMKDTLIRSLSKLEMDVLSLDNRDLNKVMETYSNLNELKSSFDYIKKFIPINDFILSHIEKHIDKYEYYLNNRGKI